MQTDTYEIDLNIDKGSISGSYKELSGVLENFTSFKIRYTDNKDGSFADERKEINRQLEEKKSIITSLVEKNLSKIFVDKLHAEYGDELYAKETRSISVSAGQESRKVVWSQDSQDINKMINYEGVNYFTNEQTHEQMLDELKLQIQTNYPSVDYEDFEINTLKGYRYTASIDASAPISVDDPSSYQAIVSPAFANVNHKPINLYSWF